MSEAEECYSIQRKVTIQQNGIIRNAANGFIIGNLELSFDSGKVQNKLRTEEDMTLWEIIKERMFKIR